jgi:carbamoyl-phosphate synthase large subunit
MTLPQYDATILRTAAGSACSVSQYQCFRELGLRVVAVDCDPLSVGMRFADAAYTVPHADDPAYVDSLLEICSNERVDIFLPALDEELVRIAEKCSQFAQRRTKVIISSVETLKICTDKLATYSFFVENGIPTVPTLSCKDLSKSSLADCSYIVKPRRGRGSTNVFLARNRYEALFFSSYIGDAIVQPKISGTEYTIDVVADYSHEPVIIAPRMRIATDSGISSKAMTCWNEEIVDWTKTIVRKLKLIGGANIQCFVSDDGDILFTEINARPAGTAILSQQAGVPFVEAIVCLALDKPMPSHIGPADDRIMLRYWQEAYLTKEEAAKLGWGKNDPIRRL